MKKNTKENRNVIAHLLLRYFYDTVVCVFFLQLVFNNTLKSVKIKKVWLRGGAQHWSPATCRDIFRRKPQTLSPAANRRAKLIINSLCCLICL